MLWSLGADDDILMGSVLSDTAFAWEQHQLFVSLPPQSCRVKRASCWETGAMMDWHRSPALQSCCFGPTGKHECGIRSNGQITGKKNLWQTVCQRWMSPLWYHHWLDEVNTAWAKPAQSWSLKWFLLRKTDLVSLTLTVTKGGNYTNQKIKRWDFMIQPGHRHVSMLAIKLKHTSDVWIQK